MHHHKQQERHSMIAAGIMSGTSLDGVDVALVDLNGCGLNTSCQLLTFHTYPMPTHTKKRIMRACLDTATTSELSALNSELGYLFADCVNSTLKFMHMSHKDLAFVASHGQTVWHAPRIDDTHSPEYPSTLQLGNSAIIAWECKTTVVSDFRSMDMAAGGQGAPLVPYSELLLYGRENTNRALVNVGGISNITALPANAKLEDVFAFDCGPGNMMIDEACRLFLGTEFDDEGTTAAQGTLIPSLYEKLYAHPFWKKRPPKSTGREVFGAQYIQSLLKDMGFIGTNHEIKDSARAYAADVIATLTHYTAFCIAQAYMDFVNPSFAAATQTNELIISGGGAHNKTLMRKLQQMLPDINVCTQDDLGYSSDAKEAIAFALMGNETLHAMPSNVPRVTGACCPVVLGNITPCPRTHNS